MLSILIANNIAGGLGSVDINNLPKGTTKEEKLRAEFFDMFHSQSDYSWDLAGNKRGLVTALSHEFKQCETDSAFQSASVNGVSHNTYYTNRNISVAIKKECEFAVLSLTENHVSYRNLLNTFSEILGLLGNHTDDYALAELVVYINSLVERIRSCGVSVYI